MLDAHLGTVGVWLAFVASLCGAAVIALGLFTHRHADAVAGRCGAAPVLGAARGPGRATAAGSPW